MEKDILGLTEVVEIAGQKVPARIDTGASRCAIDINFARKLAPLNPIKKKKVKLIFAKNYIK